MKAIITINKNDALKTGVNNYGEHEVEFDPAELTQEQRNELLNSKTINWNNKYEWSANKSNSPGPYYDVSNIVCPTNVDLQTLKALLDARIIKRVEVLAKIEADKKEKINYDIKNIQKWMSNPDKYISYDYRNGQYEINKIYLNGVINNYFDIVPGLEDAINDAKSLIFWQNLENKISEMVTKKENARQDAEKETRAKAIAQRKTTQITTWVEKHGTQSQKDRLNENLLPETEIIDAIRSATYAPLDDWPRYNKLTTSDVCNCEYDYCDVDFDVDDKESATEKEFEQLQKIKKLMPKATIELREHTGQSEDCNNTVRRTGFMVRMTVGEFEFSREYGLKTETD